VVLAVKRVTSTVYTKQCAHGFPGTVSFCLFMHALRGKHLTPNVSGKVHAQAV